MALPPLGIRYEKMSGFATTKGQMFEAKLSALLFLRGINSGLDFQLATNVKGAGDLDDVVYRFRSPSNPDRWTSFFVQLKHLENSWLTRRMLTGPKGAFSLQKYLASYEDIKRAMTATERNVLFDGDISESNFVIFTNARPNEDLGDECRSSEQVDELLSSGSGKVYRFDPDGVSEAEKAVVDSLRGCAGDGRDFVQRFFVCAAQPSEAQFDKVIKQELVKAACCCDSVEMDRLFVCFLENMKAWCEDGKYVLHRGSDVFTCARDRVLAETSSLLEVKANKLDLVFEESALLSLREVLGGPCPVVIHVGASEKSSRVTSTKLLQALDSSSHLFLGSERLLAIWDAVLTEWGRGPRNTLIVSVNNRDLSKDRNHFHKVLELCGNAVLPKKRLLILTDPIIEPAYDSKHLKDTFEFSSLTLTSRNSFLAAKFTLQGCSISLQAFFDGFTEVLSASLVEEIARSGPMLSLVPALPEHNRLYIPRGLEPNLVLRSIFQAPFLPETVAVLNATMPDISQVFLQLDSSLSDEFVLQTLRDGLLSLVSGPTHEPVLVGDTFSLATFECNYVGATPDTVSALRIRPLGDEFKRGWFVFPLPGASESDIAKLTDFHHARHFLTLTRGELIVTKTPDFMSIVREHIDVRRPATVLDVSDRVVIVCGEPGMGKSTLVTHLGNATREAQPRFWVILIALNGHTDLFVTGKHDDAFGFLTAAAGISSPLDREIFRLALEVIGNVVVILDGYDEIAPTYSEHCCRLLSKILETKARKVWVTTRISVKSELESHLSTTALRLRKFNDDDQRFYLKRHWVDAALVSGKEVVSDEELDDFIARLLEMMTHSMKDWGNDFLGVPLQAQIMAEVFAEDVTCGCSPRTLPDKLDWLQLLDMFVEKKLALYVQDKLKIRSSDTNYRVLLDSSKFGYFTRHMEAAFHLIFLEDYVKEMQSKNLIGDFSDFLKKIESGEEKTGFIVSITNGRACFVHRVFAEYFVAKWFALNLSEFAKFLEKDPYNAFRGGYVVPRFLCDLILANGLELHTAVLNGDVDKVKLLLEEGADVNARDFAGRTPLHLTAAFGFMEHTDARHVEILDMLVQNPLTDFNIKDDLLKGTPLRYADSTEYWVMIDRLLTHNVNTEGLTRLFLHLGSVNLINCILSNDLEKLLEYIVKRKPMYQNSSSSSYKLLNMPLDGNSLLAHASQYGSLRIVRMLIKRGYDVNGQTISRLATQYPPLHCAARGGHLEIVQILVNVSKSRHTEEFLKVTAKSHPEDKYWLLRQGPGFTQNLFYFEPDFVNRKAQHDKTALHFACEHGHREIVSLLIDHGADLASCDYKGRTCLHLAADTARPDVLSVLLGAVKDSDRPAFVNSGDHLQSTALHFAATADWVDSLKVLVDAGGKMTTDRYGQTPLMLASRKGHLDVVEYLVAALDGDKNDNGFCSSLSRADWIDSKDKDGWTALNLAAKFGFGNVVSFLAGQGAETQDRGGPCTGMPKDYFNEETEYYSWRGQYLDFVSRCGDKSTADIALMDWDTEGNTLLHIAARRGYLGVCDIFVKFGADVTRVNKAGQTSLMLAARNGFYYVVKYLLKAFYASAAPMAKTDYVNMKDCLGQTAANYSARAGHICTTNLLSKHGADIEFLVDSVNTSILCTDQGPEPEPEPFYLFLENRNQHRNPFEK